MIIRSKAPLRISFAGGGTDVSPYIEEKGGVVINTTINKYAYATLKVVDNGSCKIKSLDYNLDLLFSSHDEIKYDGKLDLVKAAIKVLEIKEKGFELTLHTDAAPGTGLGSSSTLTTAIIGTFKEWLNLPLTEYQLAELAYHIERVEAQIKGGKQDQYATVFGGVNFIEFFSDKTIVNSLRIKPEVLNELEYRLLLCNTKRSRLSSEIINDQVAGYTQHKTDITSALDETKNIAIDMKNAFLLGDINKIGELLDEGWKVKKRFSSKISDSSIDELYERAKKKGVIGGKLLGAGGGGHMLLLCDPNKKHAVAEEFGSRITPFAFEFRGLQTWRAIE